MHVSEDDIRRLDFLLHELVRTENPVNALNLLALDMDYYSGQGSEQLYKDLKRYLLLFHEAGAATVYLHQNNLRAEFTQGSVAFQVQGGFRPFFERKHREENEAEERRNRERRKEDLDMDLAEKTLKDYWWTKWAARIAFILSVVLGLVELLRVFNLIGPNN